MKEASFSNAMPEGEIPSAPTKRPAWSAIAVRLLQGAVYHEDDTTGWENLIKHRLQLAEYLAPLGLQLVIDEGDAMAYLRPFLEPDSRDDARVEPQLYRKQPLSYESTLLCVLLREELLRFEEQELVDQRCIVQQNALLALWGNFFPAQRDAVRLNRSLTAAFRKLEDLKLVRVFEKEPPSWEVRRILKARLPVDELERLRNALSAHADRLNSSTASSNSDEND